MEKSLCLILDKDGYVSMTLMKDSGEAIDKFTTRFDSSDEIRACFKDEIDYYLLEKGDYIESHNSKPRGDIVIINDINFDNGKGYHKKERVLYKKNVMVAKELLKCRPILQKYLILDGIRANEYGISKLAPDVLFYKSRHGSFQSKTDMKIVNDCVTGKGQTFYERLRLLTKAYEMVRTEKVYNLPTIDNIYKKMMTENMKPQPMIVENELKETFNINGYEYYPDDIPFDNDDLVSMDSEFKPDGIRK